LGRQLLEFVRQCFTSFELSYFFSFDLDDLASLGVSAITSSTFGNGESTETNQCYFTAFFQGVGNCFGERIQSVVSLGFGNASVFGEFVDQFGFVHS